MEVDFVVENSFWRIPLKNGVWGHSIIEEGLSSMAMYVMAECNEETNFNLY